MQLTIKRYVFLISKLIRTVRRLGRVLFCVSRHDRYYDVIIITVMIVERPFPFTRTARVAEIIDLWNPGITEGCTD